jgi:hypothetical protein
VSDPDAETVLGGSALTVTVCTADVLLQPLALTATEYDPAAKAVML